MDCANIMVENDLLLTVVIRWKSLRPLFCNGVWQSLKIFVAILLYPSCPISNWSAKRLNLHHVRTNSRRLYPTISTLGLEFWSISCCCPLLKNVLLILIFYVVSIAFVVLKCFLQLLYGRRTSLLPFLKMFRFGCLSSKGI